MYIAVGHIKNGILLMDNDRCLLIEADGLQLLNAFPLGQSLNITFLNWIPDEYGPN